MPLPYRTVLRLPASTDLIRLAEQETQAWLETRKKVDPDRRSGFINGDFFEPGVHALGRGRTLGVARVEHSQRGKQLLLRFVEESPSGTWQVDVLALDSAEDSNRPDTLLIEGRRIDSPDAEGQVDPPALVSSLLSRETVLDSRTPVTAEPHLIGLVGVDDVFDAIIDNGRSVTVIAASSMGNEFDDQTRQLVKQLTSKVTGVASVFVLTSEATLALNSRLPRSHQLELGRVRTYLPDVDLENASDGRRHRVLGPETFAQAIRGRHVADYLQRAFAMQTRNSLLATPLPRQLRRQWSALDDQLSQAMLEVEIEAKVKLAQEETAFERVQKPTRVPALDRLRQMLSRWLGRDPAEEDDLVLGELSSFVERQRIMTETTGQALAAAEARLVSLHETHDEYVYEFEFRGFELAESERAVAKLTERVKHLQRELTAVGKPTEAYSLHDDSTWETPSDLGELALRLTPGTSDHPVVDQVVFTGDLDGVVETDVRDQNGLYVQRCWEFVRVLNDYSERKATGSFAGSVHDYLTNDSHDGFRVTPTRHAANETQATMEQWGHERVFPVPKDVDPSGATTMTEHFKAGQQDTFAPRMYYFDDTLRSGKIYIGYIGRHLTNTKTKNS